MRIDGINRTFLVNGENVDLTVVEDEYHVLRCTQDSTLVDSRANMVSTVLPLMPDSEY
jgi:hypothetical protein